MNHTVFGMSIEEVIDAPRFVTHSSRAASEPHPYFTAAGPIWSAGVGASTGEALAAMGHGTQWLPDISMATAGVCAVVADRDAGSSTAARIRVAPRARWAGSQALFGRTISSTSQSSTCSNRNI